MSRAASATVLLIMAAVAVAGCLGAGGPQDPGSPAVPVREGPVLGTGPQPIFSVPALVDDTRAGGEPVIAVTTEGSLIVSAHPGYTHVHPDPSAPQGAAAAVVPTQGQSYLWRSTDGGETWTHVTLLPAGGDQAPNTGPRGLQGHGISDPDLTVDPTTGRIWLTDLEALAEASVSWSDDDGATWLMGNDAASQGLVDRQWLASHDGAVYLTGNYFTDRPLLKSADGVVFERIGDVPCGGDLVAHPGTGALVVGCSSGMAVSTDEGASWNTVEFGPTSSLISREPALDAAGNAYLATSGGGSGVVLHRAGPDLEDLGPVNLTGFFPAFADGDGAVIWPWVSAGSEGRVAVTFLGAPDGTESEDPEAVWYLYTAIVVDADSTAPAVYPLRLTDDPVHEGAVCQSGTLCQARTATDDTGDRRLGDFFETTVDHDGFLHVVYPETTTQPDDWVSHVGYVRLVDGPRLVVGDVPEGFPTQG